jgi:hypothetical protein
MNDAIQKTIAAVREKRDQCDGLLQHLEKFMAEEAAPSPQSSPPMGERKPEPEKPKRKYTRRAGGMAPLDLTARKKPGRKPKVVETAAQAAAVVDTVLHGPQSFAGACKRVLREAKNPMSVNDVFDAVQTRWPSICGDRDASHAAANVTYWTSKGYMEKIGMGAQATFRILKPEFFQETE